MKISITPIPPYDQLQCQIDIHELDECPPYEALSYCWGSADGLVEILLNGRNFRIRKILWDSLWQLKKSCPPHLGGERYWWIDQLCIDQNTVTERNHQVQMMGEIFRKAQGVLGWVGKPELSTSLAFRLLVDGDVEEVERKDALHAVKSLFANPYWHRLWVMQEIWLARDFIVMCGPNVLAWASLRLPEFLFGVEKHDLLPYHINYIRQARGASTRPKLDLLQALKLFQGCGCHDPRDKVYGLLGMIDQNHEGRAAILVDYSKYGATLFSETQSRFNEKDRAYAMEILSKLGIALCPFRRRRRDALLLRLDDRAGAVSTCLEVNLQPLTLTEKLSLTRNRTLSKD